MVAQSREQLFLIDGYALIYRAFFAMISRPLRSSRGENTSAVWGVANSLHRLFDKHAPTHVVWVNDAGTSFRTDTFPEYKATREKLDEELQEDFDQSVERIRELLNAFRVQLVEVDGYEADDVIGTLATHAAGQGLQAVIVSGDKDFYQLISENISLLNPGRGGPSPVDEQLVELSNAADRLGVPPERVVDYLALVGDSSDNVPGVRGIGPKTAQVLIERYGDLDSILTHAAEVKGKRAREGLLECEEEARLSRELVTIMCDVPMSLDLEPFRIRDPDHGALAGFYRELEFRTLVERVEASGQTAEPDPVSVETESRVVENAEEAERMAQEVKTAGVVALVAKPRELSQPRSGLAGLAIAVGPGRSWYLPFGHETRGGELASGTPIRNLPALSDESMSGLVGLLQSAAIPKVGHELKRDSVVLRCEGVELAGAKADTMLAAFLIDPGRRSFALNDLVEDSLNIRLTPITELTGKGKSACSFSELSPEDAATLCCAEAETLLSLRVHFDKQLEATQASQLLWKIDMPLTAVLVDMEWRGIAIDSSRLLGLANRFSRELAKLEVAIHEEAGTEFNIKSTQQLRHILFEKLQLPVIKKTKTGPSTDAEVLGQLAGMGYEAPKLLLEYRELSKLKSTYVDKLPGSVNPQTGRVHTTFNQTGASTGRLSSSEPNLQNIPVRTARGGLIRQCFVPTAGSSFIVADYSQVELRVLAHLSEDPAFIAAFQRGGDIHVETAAIIFEVAVDGVTPAMRARAKTINFATIYGQGPFSLAKQLDISQDEAREFIQLYFTRFAGVRRFLDEVVENAKKRGYVETLFGRRRYIPELRDKNHSVRSFGERTAMNSPVQGSAADIIKIAMAGLARSLTEAGLETSMLLQVHDELVLESPEAEIDSAVEIVRREMENAAKLNVPLVVDVGIGPNWLEAKG